MHSSSVSENVLNHYPSFAHRPSREDIYLLKLEALAKEHSAALRSQRPALEQLETQRRFFKRICEKQQEKLRTMEPSLLRGEYEQQLEELREKRSRMHDMLTALHEEAELKRTSHLALRDSLHQNNQFLKQTLQQLTAENNQYAALLLQKQQLLAADQETIGNNAQAIQEKERVEQKYRLVQEEIQRREKH
jgi:hypothetical protein